MNRTFEKPTRMALEKEAIQQHPGQSPKDLRDIAFASMFHM
jgi:hypothetical protein